MIVLEPQGGPVDSAFITEEPTVWSVWLFPLPWTSDHKGSNYHSVNNPPMNPTPLSKHTDRTIRSECHPRRGSQQPTSRLGSKNGTQQHFWTQRSIAGPKEVNHGIAVVQKEVPRAYGHAVGDTELLTG